MTHCFSCCVCSPHRAILGGVCTDFGAVFSQPSATLLVLLNFFSLLQARIKTSTQGSLSQYKLPSKFRDGLLKSIELYGISLIALKKIPVLENIPPTLFTAAVPEQH